MKRILIAACAVAVTVGGLTSIGSSPAAADPAREAVGSGYGASVNLLGTPAINAAGLATATLPPGGTVGPNTLVLVPAAPILVSGTAVGFASANVDSILLSSLTQVSQSTPGPYNVGGLGLLQGLDVGVGVAAPPTIPLVSASAVRAEAVGVCRGTTASYSANSEIDDLKIAGTPVALNAPITGLIDSLNTLLAPLSQVISIQRNQVTVTSEGATVNALRVTVLATGGGAPVLDLVVGHADASGLKCGPPPPQCSDGQDNDGDGLIDRNDPGCITNGVYNPNDNDETDAQGTSQLAQGTSQLARTGGDQSSTLPLAGAFALLALGALALRRRSQASR